LVDSHLHPDLTREHPSGTTFRAGYHEQQGSFPTPILFPMGDFDLLLLMGDRNRRTVYALAWSMAAVSADETSSKIKVCMHGGTIAEDTRRGKEKISLLLLAASCSCSCMYGFS
jgi:hypothetical protein